MRFNFTKNHVITSLSFNLTMLVIVFSSQEPLVLFNIFIIYLLLFFLGRGLHKVIKAIKLFIPFAIITIVINLIFVQEGNIVIFEFAGRALTLESVIYSIITSSKLLLVIIIFQAMGDMMDSDKAVSYFSSRMPKSTLTLMIAFKLIPNMKKRIMRLREVYSLRGINFDEKPMIQRTKALIPVLSVLLESSLEGAFDIGEAAYVRGFLSGRRSVYEREIPSVFDYTILFFESTMLITFFMLRGAGKINYTPYGETLLTNIVSPSQLLFSFMMLIGAGFIIYKAKENDHVTFGN